MGGLKSLILSYSDLVKVITLSLFVVSALPGCGGGSYGTNLGESVTVKGPVAKRP